MKKQSGLKSQLFLAIILMVIVLLALSYSTYAWFTYNSNVFTSRIETSVADEDISLLLCEDSNFIGATNVCSIKQLNNSNIEALLPVSTADLSRFVYSPTASNSRAAVFLEATDESKIFHGRFYMKASSTDITDGRRMSVYLDTTSGLFAADTSSQTLAAARLGIKIDGGNPTIYSLSDAMVPSRTNHTYVNGVLLNEGQVIGIGANGGFTIEADPAISFAHAGDNPFVSLEINKVYMIDVYFYLEGCDPDCVDEISLGGLTMNLAFFGALEE